MYIIKMVFRYNIPQLICILHYYLWIRLGLGVAIDYALKVGLQAIQDRVSYLASAMRAALTEIDGVR